MDISIYFLVRSSDKWKTVGALVQFHRLHRKYWGSGWTNMSVTDRRKYKIVSEIHSLKRKREKLSCD